jgi:signal transduction histidine kinase/ActR/RegA family two-component response regulator
MGASLPLPRHCYLIALSGPESGRRYPITLEVKLGRDPAATIQLAAGDISRRHARVIRSPEGEVTLEDLGSRNGTRVNGARIERQVLHHGDQVQLGAETVFLYSEISLLEEQIQHEQRMASVARLAGGIAHDYNNLMASVLADVDYLRKGLQPEPGAERNELLAALQNVEDAAKRAATLTRHVLSFANRSKAENQPFEIHAAIEDVASLLRPSYEPAVTLRIDSPPGLTLVGDAGAIHALLHNLCENARLAMPDGGVLAVKAVEVALDEALALKLRATVGTRYVMLTVQDTGIGMTPEVLDKVFEPFYSTRDVGKGSGFGLASVYATVKSHGGHVEVESEPGWGSLFRLYLPLSTAVSEAAREIPTSPATPAVQAAGTVLLVEDVEAERLLARRMLEQLGFRVIDARDGREAIRTFMSHRREITLVLLDMILPNVGGKEAFRWMRKIDVSVKVILTSAYVSEDRVKELLAEGANAFLPKPYGLDALRKIATQVVGDRLAVHPAL